MKQQEQVAKWLYQLAIELIEQIKSTDRSLRTYPSAWSVAPSSFPDVDTELQKQTEFTEAIRKHPGFVWLAKKSDFNDALQFFEKEIRKIQDSELDIARMRIGLLYAIACSGWRLLDDSSLIPRKLSKSEKAHAVEIAHELLIFVAEGFLRPDYRVMQSLEEPLIQFIKYMNMDTKREYSGPGVRPREIAIEFVLVVRIFGLKQSKVVELLDSVFSIFDIALVHRTAQRYVKEAFAR